MTHVAENRSMKTFLIVWIGQLVSMVGSGLTYFGIAVWILTETGSATQYAMISLAAILPAIFVSPIAGVYVDRWDRRKTMMVADLCAGLATLTIALLVYFGQLDLWHILAAAAFGSAAGAFQGPAYMASTSLLVPKKHLTRAAGMVQLGDPVSTILAPVLAAALFGFIGLSGLIMIDFVTFLFAMVTLAFVRFPSHKPKGSPPAAKTSVLAEAKAGWGYIAARPGLKGMLWFFAMVNFVFGFASALYAPLVMSFSDEIGLGTVMAVMGLGGIIGGIAISVWGGPKRKVFGVFLFGALLGLAVSAAGLRSSIPLIAGAAFVTMLILPTVQASSQAIWQTKTEPVFQGRVFSLRRMFSMIALPVSYVLAGPLADFVFEPGMASGGALSATFGPLIGTGPGRGIGLMIIFAGLGATLVSLAAFSVPCLRNVETDLPDVLPDDPAKEPEVLVEK